MIIYTDGACSGNGSDNAVAAWAFIVTEGDQLTDKKSGRIEGGTNNIGELTAIYEALKYVAEKEEEFVFFTPVTILSDSIYCVNGVNHWRHSWKEHNWTRKGKELKNVELWKSIDKLLDGIYTFVELKHVPGHSGVYWNECVDALAKSEI